jgi:hypothetical protein
MSVKKWKSGLQSKHILTPFRIVFKERRGTVGYRTKIDPSDATSKSKTKFAEKREVGRNKWNRAAEEGSRFRIWFTVVWNRKTPSLCERCWDTRQWTDVSMCGATVHSVLYISTHAAPLGVCVPAPGAMDPLRSRLRISPTACRSSVCPI